jgi:HSP20 family protein
MGAADQDIDVSVHDGVLSVVARTERSTEDIRVYERSFRLDRRMDTSSIEAELQRGVLHLRIPFREEARPRRIEVKSA